MLTTLVAIETAALLLGVPLLVLFLKERVKNLAREESDRTLADYRHQQEQVLAAINAAHQRRLTEFGLYARKRHAVYAALFRKVREASDTFAATIGLTTTPDFEAFTDEDIHEYVTYHRLKDRDVAEAAAAYGAGDRNKAARLMVDLHFRVKRRDAEASFVRARNIEALCELYLSDPVRAQMEIVRRKIAALSVAVRPDNERRDRQLDEKRDQMQAAVADLFNVLRDELRRSDME